MNPLEQLLCTDFRYVVAKSCVNVNMKFVPNENVLRIALTVFSICFGILSVSLIALGAVYINELKWPRTFIGLDFLEMPTFIIILGSASLLLSLAGCLCAKSYNRTFYILFGLSLIVVLCLELTIAIIAFQNNTESSQIATKRVLEEQLAKNSSEPFLRRLEDHKNIDFRI